MDEADQLRVKYLYRRLIVQGNLRVGRAAATPLVGPDCAYHLYAWESGAAPRSPPARPKKPRRQDNRAN